MVASFFKLLLALWPLWLWLLIRYALGQLSLGSELFRSAQTAGPLILFVAAFFAHSKGSSSERTLWLAAFGAVISGAIGFRWEYLLWEPYFGRPGYTPAFILVHLDWPLVLTSSLATLSPLLPVGWGAGWFRARSGPRLKRARSDEHGSARWMTTAEATAIFRDGELVIGEAYDSAGNSAQAGKAPLLRFDGRGHLLTVAGSGSGKTTSIAIPNVLSWKQGMVIHDPKMELARLCGPARRTLGRKVVVLTSEQVDGDSLNVIDWLDTASPGVIEDARAVVTWLGDERQTQGDNALFYTLAGNLILTLLLDVIFDPKRPDQFKTLRAVRNRITAEDLIPLLRDISRRPAGYGFDVVQQMASELLASTTSDKTWASIRATASELTAWLSTPTLSRLVCGGKDGPTVTTGAFAAGHTDIFVCVPLKTLESTPAVARLIIGALLHRLYDEFRRSSSSARRTLFLIDEMPRLGRFSMLETARDAGRGLGVTLWAIVQDLGQLEKHYGKEGVRGWLESSQVKSFFGIGDVETAKMLSEALGKATVETTTTSTSSGAGGQVTEALGSAQSGKSRNQSLVGRELLTPDEIMRLAVDEQGVPDEQVVFMRNRPPLRCGLAKYYRRQEWANVVGAR
jgi:type IV secretion system protein VirD4